MTDELKQDAPKIRSFQIARIICGLVPFGILMGIRQDFDSFWVRALVAGCAGGILCIFVVPISKKAR